MSGKQCSALIVVGPGDFRESVRAMLISILPDIRILDAQDLVTAESLIRIHRPSLVVIDGGLQLDRPTRLIETARKARERVYYCMLAESVGQQASALAAGADLALLKGEPPTRVFGQVERLLQAA